MPIPGVTLDLARADRCGYPEVIYGEGKTPEQIIEIFRALIDTPFRLYLGHLTGTPALLALTHQHHWTLALIAIGRYTLNRGLHRLVVQGG